MTAVPVLTAVTGAVWEAEVVAALDRSDLGVTVVRRCVDLAELLSAAAAGAARAALLSADLRGLDREAVARLSASGVVAVGLVDPGRIDSEHLLRALGVRQVLAADSGAVAVSRAVVQAVAGHVLADPRWTGADPADALPLPAVPGGDLPPGPPPAADPGRLVAVWGPTGAPGRTTVALGAADEASRLGVPTLLVDADVYGGVLAPSLGLLDEAPGLAAACRQATAGRLDGVGLAALAWSVSPTLRVLTGITRADRWPELRPSSVGVVLDHARRLARLTVVDCGFSLEQDEEAMYDTAVPRRNGATLAVLAAADVLLCVGGADPVALQRLVRALDQIREAVPGAAPQVVVNRVRPAVVPGDPAREIATALERYAGVVDPFFLPHDGTACDRAIGLGRTLAEVAPESPLRRALVELASRLAGVPAPHRRPSRRLRGR